MASCCFTTTLISLLVIYSNIGLCSQNLKQVPNVELTISPLNIQKGKTKEMTSICTAKTDMYIISLVMQHRNIEETTFKVIAGIAETAPNKPISYYNGDSFVQGTITNNTAMLQLNLPNPKTDIVGQLMCELTTRKSMLEYSVTQSSLVTVTEINTNANFNVSTLSNFTIEVENKLLELKNYFSKQNTQLREEMQKYYVQIEKRLNDIRQFFEDIKSKVINETIILTKSRLNQTKLLLRQEFQKILSQAKNYTDKQSRGKSSYKGWTTIQRRLDGTVDFYRNWTEYKNGFGDKNGDFWLGLDKIHQLTEAGAELKVLLKYNRKTGYAHYNEFTVGDEKSGYKLTVDKYDGRNSTIMDDLKYHNGMMFSTKDKDNDKDASSCAINFFGGFWYNACHSVNLNGKWVITSSTKAARWHSFSGLNSVSYSEMKIRKNKFIQT